MKWLSCLKASKQTLSVQRRGKARSLRDICENDGGPMMSRWTGSVLRKPVYRDGGHHEPGEAKL